MCLELKSSNKNELYEYIPSVKYTTVQMSSLILINSII